MSAASTHAGSVRGARVRTAGLVGGKENRGNIPLGLKDEAAKRPSFGGAIQSMMSKGARAQSLPPPPYRSLCASPCGM